MPQLVAGEQGDPEEERGQEIYQGESVEPKRAELGEEVAEDEQQAHVTTIPVKDGH